MNSLLNLLHAVRAEPVPFCPRTVCLPTRRLAVACRGKEAVVPIPCRALASVTLTPCPGLALIPPTHMVSSDHARGDLTDRSSSVRLGG